MTKPTPETRRHHPASSHPHNFTNPTVLRLQGQSLAAFGALSNSTILRLDHLLKHRLAVFEEDEFCVEAGCPPERLEAWLQSHWKEYDICAVFAGSEKVGPYPLLLGRQYNEHFTLRMYSPSDQLLRSRTNPRCRAESAWD